MKNKQQQIETVLSEPLKMGDVVDVKNPAKNSIGYGKVIGFGEKGIRVKTSESYSSPDGYPDGEYPVEWVKKETRSVGADPFAKEITRIQFLNVSIYSLLSNCGYNIYTQSFKEKGRPFTVAKDGFDGVQEGVNFDPYVIDGDGNKVYYQRGLVWSLKQKQLLLDSIYNNIEIGKFILKYNTFEKMTEDAKETGVGYDFDCVDGKQRLNIIGVFPE